MPVLGFLASASEAGYKATIAAVRSGLNEAGYVEKQNLLIEYRWADFQYERLPTLAAELANLPVDVIFATGSVVSAIAAKSATASIPIVFANGSDPVQYGLVASLNRPGGNVTGITFINSQLGPKRIQLFRLMNPRRRSLPSWSIPRIRTPPMRKHSRPQVAASASRSSSSSQHRTGAKRGV